MRIQKLIALLSLALGCPEWLNSMPSSTQDAQSADVIVYGSTPGGFCAAIAAAREGASVILLEPTDHVGGMSAGGLSHCDSNQMVRETLIGLFDEWHTRIVLDYTNRGLPAPYNPARKDQSRWTFEPHVAMRVTMEMLDEAGVTVLTERYLQCLTKDGPRIISILTTQGRFSARVFVDGTYEGDLMAAAGVDWTIGREGREAYGESLAGKQWTKQKMDIDGFGEEGDLLPLVTTDNAGEDNAGDENVMTYSFRLCLTADPENRVPMPEPADYDPARFEIVRRAFKAGERRIGFDLYPLPGDKMDGNNSIGGQFSIGLVGGGKNWHSADQAGRKKIWEAHKQYTLEFYHFLTNDPVVPAQIRDRFTNVGLCRDEFSNYDHFSPALYVRESRRMQGMYVISQKDILESPEKKDPIAISSFPIDSHDCQRVALPEGGVINEGTIFPVRRIPGQGYAYHVPYRSILPKPEQCDNLLVPIALSCTHVGISSLRIEGAWMVIGQGAGVAAALAANQNVAVQNLDYRKLRDRLLAQGQVLDLPELTEETSSEKKSVSVDTLPGILLDDEQAELTGSWSLSTNFKPYIENGYIFSGGKSTKEKGNGKSSATFRFTAPRTGQFQLLAAYSAHETRANNVPLTISSGAHRQTVLVDQTMPLPKGKLFREIAKVNLEEDADSTIQVTNEGTTGFVILDAIQLLPIDESLSKNAVPMDPSFQKPNVLMICIDDLNDWTGFLGGHPQALTPHMDALAKRGRIFANAHCAVPVCSPSRISVMSGVAATTHGSYELGPGYEQLPALANVPTLQKYFKDNGYTTLSGGKVLHHGFKGRLTDDIDRSLGPAGGPRPKLPMNLPAGWSRAWDWGAFPARDEQMADYQLAKNAAKALQEDFEKPFFMSVGFFRPHVPLLVPPRWFELYDEKSLTLPNNPICDLEDIPKNFLNINNYAAAPTHAEVMEQSKQRSMTRAYLASISFADHCVGLVMDALESSSHANNTVVVLWSDHGFHLGEKQHWAKRTLWEEATRVPLLFSGPGIKPGETCNEPVSLLDIYPTLVDLCQLPSSLHLEGTTLAPQLKQPSAPRVQPAITSSYYGNHSIRSRDWRLIAYRDGAKELYDHRVDPDEFHNLVDDPQYQNTVNELASWIPKEAAAEFKVKSERTTVNP